eukprot:4591914-Pyramimonas_sp.AAC.1
MCVRTCTKTGGRIRVEHARLVSRPKTLFFSVNKTRARHGHMTFVKATDGRVGVLSDEAVW